MTRSEVILEQRLRLALTIVYLGLVVTNFILKQKEKEDKSGSASAADSSAAEMVTPA